MRTLYEYFKTNFRSYSIRKGYVNGDLPTAGTAVVGVPNTGTENATVVTWNIDYDFDGKYLVIIRKKRWFICSRYQQ
jgi:hypothetical protein